MNLVSMIIIASIGASLAVGVPRPVAAQSYAGCFINGQQVADSRCRGDSGGGSAPSMMSTPMFGDLMSTSRALGGQIVKSLMTPSAPPQTNAPPADDGAATAAERAKLQELKAEQDRQRAGERAKADAAAQQEKARFQADKQALLNEVHGLGAGADNGDLHIVGNLGASSQSVRPTDEASSRDQQDPFGLRGATLKDSLNGNQPSSQPTPRRKTQTKPGSRTVQAHAKHTFNTEKECQAEFERRVKGCDRPDATDAICVNDQMKWKASCEAQLPPEGWTR